MTAGNAVLYIYTQQQPGHRLVRKSLSSDLTDTFSTPLNIGNCDLHTRRADSGGSSITNNNAFNKEKKKTRKKRTARRNSRRFLALQVCGRALAVTREHFRKKNHNIRSARTAGYIQYIL